MKNKLKTLITIVLILSLAIPFSAVAAEEEEKVYTLEEVIERGLDRSLRIKSTEYDLDSVEIVRDKANINLTFIPTEQFFTTPGPMIAYRQKRALDRAYESTRDTLEMEIDSVRFDLIKKYQALLEAIQDVQQAEKERHIQDVLYNISTMRSRLGLISDIEATSSSQLFEMARSNLRAKQNELDKAYQNLNALIGFEPEERYQIEESTFADISQELTDSDLIRLKSLGREGLLIRILDRGLEQTEFEYNFYVFNDPSSKPLEAIEKDIKSEEANIESTKRSLEEATRNLFFNAQQIQKNYNDLQMKHSTDQLLHRIKQIQLDLGMITKTELMQSEKTLLENEANFVSLRNAFNEIMFMLHYPHVTSR